MGLFDRICSTESRLKFPELYKSSQNAQQFNVKVSGRKQYDVHLNFNFYILQYTKYIKDSYFFEVNAKYIVFEKISSSIECIA